MGNSGILFFLSVKKPHGQGFIAAIRRKREGYEQLSEKRKGESSEAIKKRVLTARSVQKNRLSGRTENTAYNAYMNTLDVEKYCVLTHDAEVILKSAILELGLSARAYDKVLKIS